MSSWLVNVFVVLMVTCQRGDGGPMSYIVNQGCLYLSHYVKDNYIVLEPTTATTSPDDVNWATWTYTAAESRYMPPELTQALVHCGKEHAFYALDAPAWLIEHYNLTVHDLIG
ncbi:hypothetical protein BaRGS_00019736 [Batillaria attramentaria]|uniref:Uncharacterized protein n=1 Tax=Batillaria attramentaria TaxID=370345 RepID=A0ABD0KPB0_9CAEN